MTEKSQLILNTFNSTIANVFKDDMSETNYRLTGTIELKCGASAKDERYDYGTLALMLMRIWEIELNVGLVPGVYIDSLPVSQRCNAKFIEDKDDYKKRNGLATYGQSIVILKRNAKNAAAKMGMDEREFVDWLKRLECLGASRNEAAHKETMNEEGFIAFYRKFKQSVSPDGRKDYFSLLMDFNEQCS